MNKMDKYKYKYDVSKSNKERDLKLANAMQRKLMIPKLGFYGFAAIGIIALIQNIYTGEILTEKDPLGSFAMYYMFIAFPIIIITTIIFGICPHCHKTQGLNGKVVTFTGLSFSVSRGVSPFIKHCARCGAPLSKKAVEEAYRKYEEAQRAAEEDRAKQI